MLNHVIKKAGKTTDTTITWDLKIGSEGDLVLYAPDIIYGNVISINKEGTIYRFRDIDSQAGLSLNNEGRINIREEW